MYIPVAQDVIPWLDWLYAHPKVINYTTRIIVVSSVLHNILPPWDWNPGWLKDGLSEFPAMQYFIRRCFNNRWYRVLIYTVGYVALNGRSTVWKFISVKNADGPNANLNTSIDAAAQKGIDVAVVMSTKEKQL